MSRMTKGVGVGGLTGATFVIACAVALAGCSPGGQPTPAATAEAAASAAGSAPSASIAGTASTPGPTEVPGRTEVPGPPVASIGRAGETSVPGELGTFTWDGLHSDAPWIVPPGALPVVASAPLTVTLDPALAPMRWTARWAPAQAGSAGDPTAGVSGTDAAIELAAPVVPGSWGLQVEVTFSEGRRAAWYWSVNVAP